MGLLVDGTMAGSWDQGSSYLLLDLLCNRCAYACEGGNGSDEQDLRHAEKEVVSDGGGEGEYDEEALFCKLRMVECCGRVR